MKKETKIMLSCKKATLLVEKRQHEALSMGEVLQLKFHLSMCSGCKNYARQSQLIDEMIDGTIENQKMDETRIQEIINKLKEE